jgi:Asp-tRNA(Asn)/Glu-tRNA(Gln) amidotransferase C subunit
LSNITRGDEIRSAKFGIRDKILKQAPNKKGDYYKVPKILE